MNCPNRTAEGESLIGSGDCDECKVKRKPVVWHVIEEEKYHASEQTKDQESIDIDEGCELE